MTIPASINQTTNIPTCLNTFYKTVLFLYTVVFLLILFYKTKMKELVVCPSFLQKESKWLMKTHLLKFFISPLDVVMCLHGRLNYK